VGIRTLYETALRLRVALPVMPNRVHLITLAWRWELNPWNLLFVLLHLKHQTMDKVHKTDDLKMCYTINRIYRIVQIWPVWKSWQKVTSFLLTECYIAPLHAATCEEYIKCWQSSNTCLFYTHFGISPTMSQNQTKLSSITQFFLPYSDGWIFPHCLKIC